MQNNIMFVPGQQLKVFNVFRKASSFDEKNRLKYGDLEPVGFFKGTIAQASQREVERFKSLEHPVTHTIVAMLRNSVQAEDVLEHGGKKYFVQSVDDPLGIGMYKIIYCRNEAGVK